MMIVYHSDRGRCPFPDGCGESRFEILGAADFNDRLQLDPQTACRRLRVSQLDGCDGIFRVYQHGDARCGGNDLLEDFQALAGKFRQDVGDAGR